MARSLLCKEIVKSSIRPLRSVLVVLGLAEGERNVAVLDHMLDLSSHYSMCQRCSWRDYTISLLTGKGEEDNPVDDKNWPEHWDIEDREPGAEEANCDGAGGRVPELELWKTSDEWSELLILLGWQSTGLAILHLAIHGLIRWVELRLQEGEEEVEKVDAEGVCD